MADNIRELDQIQTELDRLHERSQGNKATISAHEAVCEERYAQIMTTMTKMHEEIFRGSIWKTLNHFQNKSSIKGEVVILIAKEGYDD